MRPFGSCVMTLTPRIVRSKAALLMLVLPLVIDGFHFLFGYLKTMFIFVWYLCFTAFLWPYVVFVKILGGCPGRKFILCMLSSPSFGLLHYRFVLSLCLTIYVGHIWIEFFPKASVDLFRGGCYLL